MAAAIPPLKRDTKQLLPDFRQWLRLFPPFTLSLFLVPIIVGLAGTVLPSFGYLPGFGAAGFSFAPWSDLVGAPGIGHALFVTLFTGFGATIAALMLAMAVSAAWHGTPATFYLRKWFAPLLAVPHAAFAIGFAFLLAPSGWLMRAASPWATGWERPPDFIFVQDPNGVALLLALVCKEVFFLLLMIWVALGQVKADKLLCVARTLGYRRVSAWCKTILPLVYKQIRLPVYAVLAYSLSVVDMALILGPTAPPTLSVLILNWFQDPNPAVRLQGAAGAVSLLICVVLAIALWRAAESVIAWAARGWLVSGSRRLADNAVRWISGAAIAAVLMVMVGAFFTLAIWSLVGVWRFPDFLPSEYSLKVWQDLWPDLGHRLMSTVFFAGVSAVAALVIVLGCLENEQWNKTEPTRRSLALLYMPLVVPQISFLFGLQITFVLLNLDGTWVAVVLSHLIFVLPYTYLVLSDPYRALDRRFARTASSLGVSPVRVFWRVRAPLLFGAISISFAVGFAVSVAQYLATLLPSAGRLPTLTTEAVISASGGDRRIAAVYGLSQLALPLLIFAAASAVSARRALRFSGANR
jgi:putative thiamine transport system permease protein